MADKSHNLFIVPYSLSYLQYNANMVTFVQHYNQVGVTVLKFTKEHKIDKTT